MSRTATRAPGKIPTKRADSSGSNGKESTMAEVDGSIVQIENLFRSLTGAHAPIVTETPYAPIPPEVEPQRYVEQQVDRLLTALETFSQTTASPPWQPDVSVWEDEEGVLFCVDIPGTRRETLQISSEGQSLTIRGDRHAPLSATASSMEARWQDRRNGPFQRTLTMPVPCRLEEVKAKLADGVLEIRVPRSAPSTSVSTIEVL